MPRRTNKMAHRLSDTHLVILNTAAQRDDLKVQPFPKTLKINGTGLTKVINTLIQKALLTEHLSSAGEDHWRIDDDGQRLALTITKAGLDMLGVEGEATARTSKGSRRTGSTSKLGAAKVQAMKSAGSSKKGKETKGATILRLLRRKRGASISDLTQATGWQAHSVRGFLSGTLKKKQGLSIISDRTEQGIRHYRIAS